MGSSDWSEEESVPTTTQAPTGQGMAVDPPDFLGYTGREHEFKTPVRAGPFKFSVLGHVSPEVARHYGLALPEGDAHQEQPATGLAVPHERADHPDFWGYTGREQEFKTPVRAGPFKFSVLGHVSPEVARHYGLERPAAEGRAPGQSQEASSGQEAPTPSTSPGRMKLGLGTARLGGIFGEVVTARLAKRAMKQMGGEPESGAGTIGDTAAHVTAIGGGEKRESATPTGNPVASTDFLGFTGRDQEFKTPVHVGPFKFSVIGNVSSEVARHYGIDHLGLDGRSQADHATTVSAKTRASKPAVGQGRMKLGFGPARVGGVFGEIVTAKLAQRAMKQSGKTHALKPGTGENSQAGGKSKPVKFKLSVTPHIGGLLGEKVTAKLALRARKQAAKTTAAPSPSVKKTSS